MKKNFSKCFIAAAMLVAVGCISSCKDYNDEIVSEYRGEDAKLQGQIDDLKKQHAEDLEKAKEERDRIEGELNAHVAEAEAKYATKAELEAAKAELVAADAALKAELEAADAALKSEIQNKINDIQNQINGINTQLGTLDAKIDQVKSDLEAKIAALAQCNCDIAKLEKVVTDLTALTVKVGDLEKELQKAATKDELNNYATTAQLQALQDIVNGLVSCGCGDLLSKITAIEGQLSSFAPLADLASLKLQVESDSARIDALQQAIAQIKECTQCDSLATALKALEDKHAAEIKAIEDNMANLYEKIVLNEELAKQYTDDAIAALKDYVVPEIDGLKGLLNQVRLDVEALKPLQAAVAELKIAVAANTAAIDSLTGRVGQLEEDVDNLEDALEQRISSVNIQGAYSPVVGYFNMPFGIKSNIVAAYYGEFATGETEINFPFVYSSSMLDGSFNALNDLKASLGYEGETIDELSDGKAGKIYMTINPTEVDLTNVEFALVNSLGENAPVELTVQPSEDKLSFGYTRAGGATLYEALATIKDTEATEFSLNESDYKDIFSDLKDGGDIDLSAIAEVLYGTFNEIADANAVSAAWTDAMGHSHTVLSNYDIAAVSVQPLSFAFMQDVTVETVPGYETAKDIIDEMIEELNEDVSFSKFENLKSGLYKYLDKLNDRLSGVINSVNAKLQPVLLISEDKDFKLLGQSESRPVEVASEITLVPTTYTAELLAPAFKKYVAITAVNGSTDNLAAVNAAAGEQLNKVLDGDVREITFKGESGNTYEITYSALDYAGFVVNTKYYVTVK